MNVKSVLVGVLDENVVDYWLSECDLQKLVRFKDGLEKGIFTMEIADMFGKFVLVDKDRSINKSIITSLNGNVHIDSMALPPGIKMTSIALAVTGLKDGKEEDEDDEDSKQNSMLSELHICAPNKLLTEDRKSVV